MTAGWQLLVSSVVFCWTGALLIYFNDPDEFGAILVAGGLAMLIVGLLMLGVQYLGGEPDDD